jgi:hypothetical protein
MLSINPWLELSNTEPGLFQLVGSPKVNFTNLLYGKALLARREGYIVYYIDNHGLFDLEKLKQDLEHNRELLKGFFIFSPKNMAELLTIIDDLELQYKQNGKKQIICISSIFEFLTKNPTHMKTLFLMVHAMGILKQSNLPVFVTNEMRKFEDLEVPFLSFFIPPFFTKVFIIEQRGKESNFLTYNF